MNTAEAPATMTGTVVVTSRSFGSGTVRCAERLTGAGLRVACKLHRALCQTQNR